MCMTIIDSSERGIMDNIGGGSLRARPYNNEKNACRYEIIYALTYVTITNLKFITDGN